MAQQAEAPQQERKGREGGRWINERPSAGEFAEWFQTSMRIDEALNFEDYIGGVVLIPAVDSKAKYVSSFRDGKPVIEERPELVFTPYAKVESRIDYFWDLVDAHEDWVGVVEHVTPSRIPLDFVTTEEREVTGLTEGGAERERTINRTIRRPSALTSMIHQLPQGFSVMSVPVAEGYTHFLCCTIRVAIYRADADGNPKGAAIRTGTGTKQVPLLKRGYNNTTYADDSSLMKAETGAKGRAIGFAGIFVIPGSGVATAEDVLEAMSQGPSVAESAPSEEQAKLPEAAPARTGAEQAADTDTQLRARAGQLWQQLSSEAPEKATEFGQWVRRRGVSSLGEARGAMLVGVVRKLEKLVDEHEQAAQQGASEETGNPGGALEGERDEPSGEPSPETAAESTTPDTEIPENGPE